MATLTPGSVTVADDGSEVKSGVAEDIYDEFTSDIDLTDAHTIKARQSTADFATKLAASLTEPLADTGKVLISSGDTTYGYLHDKLVAGSNITLTKNNAGANETLTIASTGGGGGGSYTDEEAQDAVGSILVDSASIDFTYSDGTPSITAAVLPAGVDHNSLNNYSANRHIDHTAVNINAGAQLTGGGDISSSRTIALATTAVSAGSYGTATAVAYFTVNAYGQLTSATQIPIALTASSISDFNEAAQDAVGGILTDSASVDFTYTDGSDQITAAVLPAGVNHDALLNYSANKHVDHTSVTFSAGTGLTGGGTIAASRSFSLATTGVSAGLYGSATKVGYFTVNTEGQITSAGEATISLTSSSISDFNEAAQDAVGGALVDSSSIDFTYTDGSNQITAAVLPAGVDHNSLNNYSANRHTDHTAVTMTASTGLSGGGDISASRSFSIANTGVSAGTYGSATKVAVVTFNAQGQATSCSEATITGTTQSIGRTFALMGG